MLVRRKFRLSAPAAEAIVRSLRKLAIEIVPSGPLRACSDPTDDKFLECAAAAGVAYLVTGNLRHFPRLFRGVRAIAPAALLREAVPRRS